METKKLEDTSQSDSFKISDNDIISNVLTKNVKDSTDDLLHELAINVVREKLQIYQTKIINDVTKKVECMVEDVLQEVKRYNVRTNDLKELLRDQTVQANNRRQKSDRTGQKVKKLPEKEFMARNSLLIDLFEVKHIKSIYHMFLVIPILLFLNTFIHDFVNDGRFNVGLGTVTTGFAGFSVFILIWCIMNIPVLGVYYAFKLWANVRLSLKKSKGPWEKLWNTTWFIVFVVYQISFLTIFSLPARRFGMGPISTITALMEMTRLIMKVHAYVRYNVPRQLQGKLKTDSDNKATVPTLSQYVYFLFAPTLIYRDSYPRTTHIRWNFAFLRLAEVAGIIFFLSYIHERVMVPNFKDFGRTKLEAGELVVKIFNSIMPGILLFLSGFYCILHSWLNATSEILRFADRLFYRDWWNSITFDNYYRTWNIVVHDWLYEFIYKDVYYYVFKGSKAASALVVFIASAVVHEHILSLSFGFFYPVMICFFLGAGTTMFFLTRNISKDTGNLLTWIMLIAGNGLMVALYYMEYYARQNCPLTHERSEFFTPISWYCNGLTVNPNWKLHVPWE